MLPLLSDHLLYDQLLAAEMEIRIDPARKESVLKKLTDSYQNSDRSVMLELARWLNSRGYRSEVIAFAGGVRPLNDTDWLLVVLDAKSAQGRWDEVSAMLDSPASAGIPDAVRDLFLARIASMRGDQKAADEAWSSETASLYLEKPETLAYIAGYEEQIGAMDQAARTYRELANRDSTRKIGLTALIRIQSPTTPAKTLIPLYEELLAEAPDYADAAGDLDYLKLLVGEEIPQAAGDAEKLFESQPNSLARISTAALGRLKQGDVKGALSLYEGKSIDWGGAPAPWRVVRSAVLRAAGDIPGAEKMAASIDSGVLRPEEAALLGKR
jgi:tetratricopeptide (TPR) repeat protein